MKFITAALMSAAALLLASKSEAAVRPLDPDTCTKLTGRCVIEYGCFH